MNSNKSLVLVLQFLFVFLISQGKAALAEKICLNWDQTNFADSCAACGILREGDVFVYVNQLPVPFVTTRYPYGGHGAKTCSFKGCFEKAFLNVGENRFYFSATVLRRDYYGYGADMNYCTHIHHAVRMSLPGYREFILFDILHQGRMASGENNLNFTLRQIEPLLAREFDLASERLKTALSDLEQLHLNSGIQYDVERNEYELLSTLGRRLQEITNGALPKMSFREFLVFSEGLADKLRADDLVYLSDFADRIRSTAQAYDDQWQKNVVDATNRLERMRTGLRAKMLDLGLDPDQTNIGEVEKRIDHIIAQNKVANQDFDFCKTDGGEEFLAKWADETLKKLQNTIGADRQVSDRKGFLQIYEKWLSEQVALAKKWGQQGLCTSTIIQNERNKVKIEQFVQPYYDENGWFKDSPVAPELRALISKSLTSTDRVRAKRLQERLNLWEPQQKLKPQQDLINQSLAALLAGHRAEVESQAPNAQLAELMSVIDEATQAISEAGKTTADAVLGVTPFVGDFKDFCEAVTGRHMCLPNGDMLSKEDRVYAAMGMVAGSGIFWKGVGRVAKVGSEEVIREIGKIVKAPKLLKAFPDAKWSKPKTPIRRGGKLRERWIDDSGSIYEWDSRHGTVEKYNKRGKHLGEFDPNTGARTKPANPRYSVEP